MLAALTAPAVLLSSTPVKAEPNAPDTTAPVVSSTGFIDGGWLPLHSYPTPVYSDDVAVTKLEVLVNDTIVASHEGKIPTPLAFQTPFDLHDREVSLTVRAYDAAGNRGEKTTRVRVDHVFPQAEVTPAAGSTLTGKVTFTATDTTAHPNRPGDLTRVEIKDEQGRLLGQATQAPWQINWDTTGLNGDVIVWVRLFDRADNALIRSRAYRIDNGPPPPGGPGNTPPPPAIPPPPAAPQPPADRTGPAVTRITPGHGTLVRGTVTTTVQATDTSGIASARVTGGKDTGRPFTWKLTPTRQGPFTIEWTVTDRLGNRTVARRTVINDTVKPALRITKAPKNGAKVKGTVKVAAAASDRNGIRRVELLVNGKVVATDTTAGYTFTVNPKRYGKRFTVRLRTYDKAGNVTVSTARTWHR